MNRKETTEHLSNLLRRKLICEGAYWASEVTFDYATIHPIRVDFMQFKPVNQTISGIEHGTFTAYEVKSCKADFKSKNGHNFIADKNYYVMPMETFEQVRTEIPWDVGVYAEVDGELKCIKNAGRRSRSKPITEMLFMMLRSGK